MENKEEIKEEWRDVHKVDFYQVSNLGRVRSLDRTTIFSDGRIRKYKGKILRPNTGTNGYLYVNCCVQGHCSTIYIHKAVAESFLGISHGLDVDHINSVKTDNRLSNLRYLTHFENASRANIGKYRNHNLEKNPRTKTVIGYLNGKEVESFDCAKKLTKKYGINYSTLRYYLQNGGIDINGIYYKYGVTIA